MHSVLHTEVVQVLVFETIVGLMSEWAAADSDVIEQSTRPAVWGVNRTQKSPTFR